MTMLTSPCPLELRSIRSIALGYFAGAVSGGLVGAFGILFMGPTDGKWVTAFLATFVAVTIICMIVEVVIASPLLLLYRRYRWRFLNRWTATLLGIAIGAAPMLLVLSRPFPDGTSEFLGYFSEGHLTPSGYWRLLKGAAWSGSIGGASAATLALFAVRSRQMEPARRDCS